MNNSKVPLLQKIPDNYEDQVINSGADKENMPLLRSLPLPISHRGSGEKGENQSRENHITFHSFGGALPTK